MKKLLAVVFSVLFLMMIVTGCSGENAKSSDSVQKKQNEALLKEATRQTGMPNITHFFERKMMKSILEMRDDPQLTTYIYVKNEYTGKYVYFGRSIGFGLPYSTQYTNPEKRIGDGVEGEIATIPQADPNGLFSPDSADATWVMLIDENTNEPQTIYIEDKVTISPFKLPARLLDPASLPAGY